MYSPIVFLALESALTGELGAKDSVWLDDLGCTENNDL